uniref:Uncharacterized protein n=1 Tax=Magallana gigas TaxID=29159 RepID=K1QMU3_MAGGI
MQLKICYLSPPAIPDYSNFDVTLLYKLIRNLCPSLEPTQGWGKDPADTDIQIGDDIERLRIFRNNIVRHSSSEISDSDFEICLKELRSVLQRIQNHMTSKGYNVNYEEKMTNIKQLDLGDDTLNKCKIGYIVEHTLDRLKQADDKDVPNAEISTVQQNVGSETMLTPRIVACPSPDGVQWQQSNDGTSFNSIDISQPKYYGSTPNIAISHETCVTNKSITLIGDVFVYENAPVVQNVFWTKNGEKLDIQGSGGRYTEVTVDNPSLTIFKVKEHDAGSYQLTATNDAGSTTSDFLILDVPDVSFARPEKKNNGSFWVPVTVQAIPAPNFVRWSIKENTCDAFVPIDENLEEFKGTSNTLPHPVLKDEGGAKLSRGRAASE